MKYKKYFNKQKSKNNINSKSIDLTNKSYIGPIICLIKQNI